MKKLLFASLLFALISCKKKNNSSSDNTSSNTGGGSQNCGTSCLISSNVPVFSGPDSLLYGATYNQYYTIFSDGNTADTMASNTIQSQNYSLIGFPVSNCPQSFINNYNLDMGLTWVANNFYSVTLGLAGPGDSAYWRTTFKPGRYGVLFDNSTSAQIKSCWGTPIFTYSDSPSYATQYEIDRSGISGVDNYNDICEIKFLGRFVLTSGTVSRFQVKGEIKLKMKQVQNTSIIKNITIKYKKVVSIES